MRCCVRILYVFGLLVSVGYALNATATTVIQLSLGQLTAAAQDVFVGTVTRVEEVYDAGTRRPSVRVEFADLERWKGAGSGDRIVLSFPGGTHPDGVRESVAGVPQFEVGDRSVIFAHPDGRYSCPTVGVWLGRMQVLRDPEVGDIVQLTVPLSDRDPSVGEPTVDAQGVSGVTPLANVRKAVVDLMLGAPK